MDLPYTYTEKKKRAVETSARSPCLNELLNNGLKIPKLELLRIWVQA